MQKRFRIYIFLYCCIILLFAGCKRQDAATMLLPGYSFYDAPNDLDRTGLIFRVTPERQRFNVGYVQVKPDSGRIEIKSTEQNRNMSLGAFLSFLKIEGSTISADVNLDLKRMITLKIKMSNNTQEALTDFELDAKLKDAQKVIEKNRAELGRQDDKYYIIRESILTKNMEYSFDKDVLTEVGVKVALDDLLKIDPNAKFDNSKLFQLGFNYPKPLRVFYKAEYLTMMSSATGGVSIRRQAIPAGEEELYTEFKR